MPTKISTTVSNISKITNKQNADLIVDFYQFMKENGSSERHQNNNLKTIIAYSNFIGPIFLAHINNKEVVL
jgi:hypothetical protein